MTVDPDPDDPRVLRALLDHASEFLVFTDRRGGVVATAGAGLEQAGFATEGTGRHIGERIHPDDLAAVLEIIEQARSDPGFRASVRARALGDDGRWRTFSSDVVGVSEHPVLGTGAVVRSRVESAASATDTDRFLSLATAVPVGVMTGDVRGWVVFANQQAREILGLVGDDVFGENWRSVVHPDDLEDALDAGRLALQGDGPQHATFRVRRDDTTRWATITVSPLGSPPRPTGWVATLEDVTERHRRLAELAHQATHDPLTGLPNRSLLEDRLEHLGARSGEALSGVSILFVDLDGFKGINDTLGHHVGDEVLRVVARRLRHTVRPSDTVARLGGDEFVVVLEGTDEAVAEDLAGRVHRSLVEPIRLPGEAEPASPAAGTPPDSQAVAGQGDVHDIVARASVGWATAGADDDIAGLLARADRVMYQNKGRDNRDGLQGR